MLGKETREKLSTDKVARGQVGGTDLCEHQAGAGSFPCHLLQGLPLDIVDLGAWSFSVGGNPGNGGVLSSIPGPPPT